MGCAQSVFLPQNDPKPAKRAANLLKAQMKYQLEQKTFGLNAQEQEVVNIVNIPPMLRKIPKEEKWGCCDLCHFACQNCCCRIYQGCMGSGEMTIQEMIEYFDSSVVLSKPEGYKVWRDQAVGMDGQTRLQQAQADHWFAWQRLNGVTRNLITRVHNIPTQFQQVEHLIENNHPYLGNRTIAQCIQEKDLFAVDLTNFVTAGELPAVAPISPIALFVIFNNKLMPVAMQLVQGGQVYTPANLSIWIEARMWFNMMEAHYHESITHFGFTHLLMDGVSVCMHRFLSDRHPIYKLLHPHFHYMHFINELALSKLVEPGGFVDRDMFFNHVHVLSLIARERYDLEADIEASIKTRGVKKIPGYLFRDDALAIRKAIRSFVDEYTTYCYPDDQSVVKDWEIHAFRLHLIMPRNLAENSGGCGMNGIPEFDGRLNLVEFLTNIIYICSVEHSATNFPQYEQYAFPPNFPGILHIVPEDTLDAIIPTKEEMLSTVRIMKLLTLRLTKSLGDYEKKYLDAMDSHSRALVSPFRANLTNITRQINMRNEAIIENNRNNPNQMQEYPYRWLLPRNVTNSISI
ncbi:polyunsaturated fatty acid lipoxygenase ALOX15B-like [Crassostrea virginica]